MGVWEFTIIILLCVLLLKPKDMTILTKNISTLIIHINKYINTIKAHIIKSIDTKNKN